MGQHLLEASRRLARLLRPHLFPLALVIVAYAIGQLATLIQQPLAAVTPDTQTYVHAAQQISNSPAGLIEPFRTPGYPIFLLLIFSLTGGVDFTRAQTCNMLPASSYCYDTFQVVVIAQAVLMLVILLECYVIAYRLSGYRWIAAIATSLLAINVFFVSWERAALTELLSVWGLVTVFLCFERFIRRPGAKWAVLFALSIFLAVMIRPFNVYLPLLLFGLVLLRALWLRQFRQYVKYLAICLAVFGIPLLGYMALNAQLNGFFGLTNEHNNTLLGKVMEYRMEYLPTEPQYQGIQSDIIKYVDAGGTSVNPNTIISLYPDKHYGDDNFRLMGSYAQSVIVHHPLLFAQKSLHDIVSTWKIAPRLYSPYQNSTTPGSSVHLPFSSHISQYPNGVVDLRYEPIWFSLLLSLSVVEQYTYLLLPFLLLGIIGWVWRRPRDTRAFMMLTMLVTVVGAIVLAAIGNFAEFYRVRYPTDWEVIIITVIATAAVARALFFRSWTAQVVPARDSRRTPVWEEETMPYHALALTPPTIPSVAVTPTNQSLNGSARGDYQHSSSPDISIVLPCLNEEEAIGECVDTIQRIIRERRLNAEIVVVDNASTDRSAEIARAYGARVVFQPVRGYGNAYIKGFAEARGNYIVMADADLTYDFHEIERFVALLRQGYDLVMGNRFSGRMAKGAMTWSHRYIGNPILSGLLNFFFRTGIRDAHCGMRAFTKSALDKMQLRTGGMEFASEMVINAAKAGLKITEQPIAYNPRIGDSKLHTIRDGWRHLRFLLLYSPTHLFLIPGVLLLVSGLLVLVLLLPGPLPLFGHAWDVHMMILASFIAIVGLQIILLGFSARFFSLTEELDGERDPLLNWLNRTFTLERGLLCGLVVFAPGFLIDIAILVQWITAHFGPLDAIRPAICATTLMALGAQIAFGSFFLSFLQFKKSIHENMLARAAAQKAQHEKGLTHAPALAAQREQPGQSEWYKSERLRPPRLRSYPPAQ